MTVSLELSGLVETFRQVVREEISAALAVDSADDMLGINAAAEYLNVSPGHIRNLVSDGKLPRHGARGARLRFRRRDLDARR